jgi:tRNA (guanine10-N2)-dimethyltransferase
LFETDKKELVKKVKGFDWQSIYKHNFCIRVHNGDLKEAKLASYIWRKLRNPKVKLINSKTSIEFFIVKNKVYAARLVKELKHDFELRKAHKRPELHPTALNPKLARALINLCGAEKEIMDPFCGAGGILIEAGLIKLKSTGYDLYDMMIKKAKVNLEYYKLKNYRLIKGDALKIKKKYDYIVTDIPYGLNTSIWVRKGNKNKKIVLKQSDKKQKIENLENFYLRFLKNLKKIMGKKAVIIFPHYVNYKVLVRKAGFKIEKEFSQFIHGSLTRRIVVLS